MRRFFLLCVGTLLFQLAHGQTLQYKYWFDGHYEDCQTDSITMLETSGNIQIDVGMLPTGVHTITIITPDTSQHWSTVHTNTFFRMPDTIGGQLQEYHFWFDNDYSTLQTNALTSNHLLLDVASLSVGIHSVNFFIEGGNTPQNYLFYKVEDTIGIGHRYHCWFDGDMSTFQTGMLTGQTFQIDVSSLIEGLHTVSIQIERGGRSVPESHVFFKMPVSDGTARQYSYWFDEDYSTLQTGTVGSTVLSLHVDSLNSGLHYVNLQIDGSTGPVTRHLFYKIPNGGYGITRYDYCLNGDWSHAHQYDTTATDTLNIIRLLPVDSLPIRSTSFFFDPNEGVPLVRAQNSISFRFWDNDYRFVERMAHYVDYNVTDTIFADTLERDTTKVIAAPVNNNIHWFKLSAGRGDSLSFQTDRSCTMQLYAPSGEMVFHASGDSVLNWDGCHAWEDGVYYLAVHDAEGIGNIAVSYQWIYRYAVLAWDVHRVGNGGISTITFEGNGFDSISTIIIYNNSVDTIIPLAIYGCRSECSVTIDFTNAQQGLYDLRFGFGDYLIDINDILTVEPSVDITIGLSVEYANNFLRGTSAVYNVSITNYGNSTMYDVPIEIMIRNDTTIDNIRRIRIVDEKNDEWGFCGTGILSDTLDANVKTIIKDILDNRTGLNFFFAIQDSLSHYENLYTMSLLTIPPYGQYTFRIEILSTDTVSCYVSIPYEWPFLMPVLTNDDTSYHNSHILMNSYNLNGLTSNLSRSQSNMCCEKEKIECLINTTLDLASYFPGVGCAASTIDFFTFYAIELWCASEGNFYDKWYEFCYQQSHKDTPLRKATVEKGWNAILQCLTMSLDRAYKELKTLTKRRDYHHRLRRNWNPGDDRYIYHTIQINALDVEISDISNEIVEFLNILNNFRGIYDAIVTPFRNVIECRQVWQNGTGCNDTQTDGGSQPPVNSLDPNDIFGYLAESGSHAISADQHQVLFVVEFENDTALATAHAHTVIVTDTLDGDKFDLNSFSATTFEIGDNVTTINGSQNFIRTVDMRPEIDVLAQVHLDYHIDSTFSVATWTFSSLDPMTLQPAIADTLGFLGIGGTGEVGFTINRKANLLDSAVIANRAYIKFDNEAPMATSTWVNIVDNTPPISHIDSISFVSDTVSISMSAEDNLSGVWQYNVYGQVGDVWIPLVMHVSADTMAVFEVDTSRFTQFLTTAIDSAGNVEPLRIIPITTTIYDTVSVTACNSYIWYDSIYSISGAYSKFFSANDVGADDTLTTLLLTINHSTTGDTTAVACDSFTWHGETYTTGGMPMYQTTNTANCDSIVTMHLTVNYSVTTFETITACDSWQEYFVDTTLTNTYTTADGCDSTHTISLTINYSTTSDTTAVACDSLTWHGVTYTTSTNEPTFITTNADGCDSTVTLYLTINYSTEILLTDTAEGSYIWHDSTYTESGTYTWNGTTNEGCDSTVTLLLVINPVGIDVVEGNGIIVKVYPNPTSGLLTVDATDILSIDVIDQTGRNVDTYTNTNRIDLGDLPTGSYILKIHLQRGQSIKRVILR